MKSRERVEPMSSDQEAARNLYSHVHEIWVHPEIAAKELNMS